MPLFLFQRIDPDWVLLFAKHYQQLLSRANSRINLRFYAYSRLIGYYPLTLASLRNRGYAFQHQWASNVTAISLFGICTPPNQYKLEFHLYFPLGKFVLQFTNEPDLVVSICCCTNFGLPLVCTSNGREFIPFCFLPKNKQAIE